MRFELPRFLKSQLPTRWKGRSPQMSQELQTLPDLMQKNQIRLGKMLLLAGLGLAALVILETRQEMVEALEAIGSAPTALSAANPSGAMHGQSESAEPPQESIAISADRHAAHPEQQISQVDPSQMAVNQWAGSSFPVENFQIYTSPFGYRQSATGSGIVEFHYGLDMAAPQGSYVHNWWTGTVVEMTDNTNCGTSVVVESGHWTHIYCHMQGHVETENGKRYLSDRDGGIQIWEGQQVLAGTRIGRVGMTGRTTGPHLHWGLKYDGDWVDPALVIRAMYAGQQAAARSASAGVQ